MTLRILPLCVLALALSSCSSGGLSGIRDSATRTVAGTVGRAAADRVGYTDLLDREPITTKLADARWAAPAFSLPASAGRARPLADLQQTAEGFFVLREGLYSMHVQSYCLHAGTHGPGSGDGYLYAPPLGPADDAVMSILRNSVRQPRIAQRDIQLLLWAIVARAQVEDLDGSLRAVAAQLLTPRQLATLNRDALSAGMDLAMQGAPPAIRRTLEAEQRLRTLLTTGGSFADMERAAVLSGAVGLGPGSRTVPSGQWSLHPDGFYVRYDPQGYTNTIVQVYVAPRSAAIGRPLDLATQIAVPGNTSRQRLAQSARPYSR